MAKLAVEDTKMGNVYHKILKHHLVADKTLGTSDLETRALSGDRGLTLVEMAPFGIIGAITPSTNPSCTVICNSICMLAGGNGVIFNPHPHAKRISAYAVDLVNRAILAAGGPENIVCTVKEPTRETSAKMVNDPSVRMLVATGGRALLKCCFQAERKLSAQAQVTLLLLLMILLTFQRRLKILSTDVHLITIFLVSLKRMFRNEKCCGRAYSEYVEERRLPNQCGTS